MYRQTSISLAVLLLLGGFAATAEAQQRRRASQGVARPVARTNQATFKLGSSGLTLGGQNQVVAQLPDLQITRVTPDEDGRPPQRITVTNGGGMTASSYDIRMLVLNGYGQVIYQIDIRKRSGLPPGASRTITLPTTAGDGASWSLRLDPANLVREGNEKNNFWANSRER